MVSAIVVVLKSHDSPPCSQLPKEGGLDVRNL